MDVSIHGDFQSRVTQQFLNDFGVLSIGIQDRAERVTEGVPADSLLQTNLLSRALDVNAIDRIWPIRLRTRLVRRASRSGLVLANRERY